MIRRFSYDDERGELTVTFVSGRRYVYLGVPRATAEDFRAAFSKGVFFNAHIRDHFDFREFADAMS